MMTLGEMMARVRPGFPEKAAIKFKDSKWT